MWMNYGV